MMKIKLKISDRFALLSLLPRSDTAKRIRPVKKLMDQLLISDTEKKELHVIDQGNQTHWDEDLDEGKVFEIDSLIKKVVTKKLEDLDKAKKITTQLITLYDLFVEGKHGNDSAEDQASKAND